MKQITYRHEGGGCLIPVGLFCLIVASGYFWGAAVGWSMFGIGCIALYVYINFSVRTK